MSLKAFHIVFVTLSSALSFAFAGWALGAGGGESTAYKAAGFAALALGAGLIAYGFWFWRKINRLV